jgi:cystathionine gamma-synthase/methionine-gamma-lyase
MRAHEENARKVAAFLQQHDSVGLVHWPGLPAHPQAELAKTQMANFSGLLSFTATTDSLSLARRLAERLKVFAYAVSLGKTKSLLFYISTDAIIRSSFRFSEDGERAYRELAHDGVFRVSVGLENAEDLIGDLEQALS